jgi:hypothetical protein
MARFFQKVEGIVSAVPLCGTHDAVILFHARPRPCTEEARRGVFLHGELRWNQNGFRFSEESAPK